jgi:hypothetical protein
MRPEAFPLRPLTPPNPQDALEELEEEYEGAKAAFRDAVKAAGWEAQLGAAGGPGGGGGGRLA